MLSKEAIALSDTFILRLVKSIDENLWFWKVSYVSTYTSKCHIS